MCTNSIVIHGRCSNTEKFSSQHQICNLLGHMQALLLPNKQDVTTATKSAGILITALALSQIHTNV